MIKNTALVLEGGGFRGIFTAGVLEVFLEKQLFFESVYGVSAGASYGVSYISKQQGRNMAVNEYIGDKRYCSIGNLLKEGSYFSWDFIFSEIPDRIVPFDYRELRESESKFYVAASNCQSGTAEYFLANDKNKEEFKTVLTASCSLPLIAPTVSYGNKHLLDGGLADSIPFEKALADGHDKIVVILTQPAGYQKTALKSPTFFKWYFRKQPKVFDMLASRHERYNASLKRLAMLEKEGVAYVIRPNEKLAVSRLENKASKTAAAFRVGKELCKDQLPKIEQWLEESAWK